MSGLQQDLLRYHKTYQALLNTEKECNRQYYHLSQSGYTSEKLSLLQNAATECRQYLQRTRLEGQIIYRIDCLLAQCRPQLPEDRQLEGEVLQVEDRVSCLSLVSDPSSRLLKYAQSLLGQVSPERFVSDLQSVISVNDRPRLLRRTDKKLRAADISREDLLHDNLFHAHSLFHVLRVRGQLDLSASQIVEQTWLQLLAAVALCHSGAFEPSFLFTVVDRLLDTLRTALGMSYYSVSRTG
jgi:hypothetical protein